MASFASATSPFGKMSSTGAQGGGAPWLFGSGVPAQPIFGNFSSHNKPISGAALAPKPPVFGSGATFGASAAGGSSTATSTLPASTFGGGFKSAGPASGSVFGRGFGSASGLSGGKLTSFATPGGGFGGAAGRAAAASTKKARPFGAPADEDSDDEQGTDDSKEDDAASDSEDKTAAESGDEGAAKDDAAPSDTKEREGKAVQRGDERKKRRLQKGMAISGSFTTAASSPKLTTLLTSDNRRW
jgi:hypothetical protein